MKPTFIITSAINTNVGVYSPELRILQTHETINSIQAVYPDAILVLVDGGRAIQDTAGELNLRWSQLKARCQVNMNLQENAQIAHLHKEFFDNIPVKTEMGGTTGLTKSVAELTLMRAVLDAIKNNDTMQPVRDTDRIFKISGRYQLSPLFETEVYDTDAVTGKYVFRQRDASWMPDAEKNVGTGHGYASRLWSFTPDQIDDVIERFDSMIDDCMEITTKHYIDIEHLLFKHFSETNPVELEHTHLMGTIAPTGVVVYD